jgi:hypothetical protein
MRQISLRMQEMSKAFPRGDDAKEIQYATAAATRNLHDLVVIVCGLLRLLLSTRCSLATGQQSSFPH